jgi:hypothetical protein
VEDVGPLGIESLDDGTMSVQFRKKSSWSCREYGIKVRDDGVAALQTIN